MKSPEYREILIFRPTPNFDKSVRSDVVKLNNIGVKAILFL